MEIYCGNNALDHDLVSGKKREGTPYECFRKGIGKGKNLPAPEGKYKSLHESDIFCGKALKTEDSHKYRRTGFPYECLQKGVGVGKGLSQQKMSFRFGTFGEETKRTNKYLIFFAGSLGASFILGFGVLWLLKPSFVMSKNSEGVMKISSFKTLLYSLAFGVIMTVVLELIFYLLKRKA